MNAHPQRRDADPALKAVPELRGDLDLNATDEGSPWSGSSEAL